MAIKAVFFCLAAMLVMGCTLPPRGILYNNTTEPYTNDFRDTSVGKKCVSINSNRIQEPLTQVRLSGEWDNAKLMRVAREEGITKLHYIDIKTLSIALGIYRRTTLILYGD
jgi:hypothetical protein